MSLLDRPAGEQAEHVDLAGGEPGGPFAAAADAVPGGGEHRFDRIAVEAAGLDLGAQLRGRGIGRERRPVRTRLAHRLVGVGRAEDRAPAGEIAAPGQAPRDTRNRRAARGAGPRCAPSGASAADCCSIRSVR